MDVKKVQPVRLFYNLMTNTLVCRRSEVTPKIQVRVEDRERGWRFETSDNKISDNSIRIAPSDYDRIVKISQRLHHRHRVPSTGIDLAIYQHIAKIHHSNSEVELELDRGMTFYWTLPKIPDRS
ncbi:MAG: hypothetical protein J7641_21485 [Cyanobacteria bacterium SID2]|nr:hypothetical protein [Cyanobacteria bacterium SID2]